MEELEKVRQIKLKQAKELMEMRKIQVWQMLQPTQEQLIEIQKREEESKNNAIIEDYCNKLKYLNVESKMQALYKVFKDSRFRDIENIPFSPIALRDVLFAEYLLKEYLSKEEFKNVLVNLTNIRNEDNYFNEYNKEIFKVVISLNKKAQHLKTNSNNQNLYLSI